MHDELSLYIEEDLHKVKPVMCIYIPKANYLYAHLQGEPFTTYEDNVYDLLLSDTFIPVENFNQFVINHQKGGDCKCI